ncbi:hypothetical protein BGY98DRAFT_184121 [Russula aff. rugulosa BPL654]|nr:hypothetical protein BGY98DRAFT_184121 [Russula aff. rugulosa BPL654]
MIRTGDRQILTTFVRTPSACKCSPDLSSHHIPNLSSQCSMERRDQDCIQCPRESTPSGMARHRIACKYYRESMANNVRLAQYAELMARSTAEQALTELIQTNVTLSILTPGSGSDRGEVVSVNGRECDACWAMSVWVCCVCCVLGAGAGAKRRRAKPVDTFSEIGSPDLTWRPSTDGHRLCRSHWTLPRVRPTHNTTLLR